MDEIKNTTCACGAKENGDSVFAGSINNEGYLEIRADRLASESTLSKIMQLAEEAEEHKAPASNSYENSPVIIGLR